MRFNVRFLNVFIFLSFQFLFCIRGRVSVRFDVRDGSDCSSLRLSRFSSLVLGDDEAF